MQNKTKKYIKIMILICAVFLMNGCTVKYSINIKDGNEVNDILEIDFPTKLASFYFQEPNEYVDDMFEIKTEEYGMTNYTLKKDIGPDDSKATLTSTKTLDEFFRTSPFKTLYTNISVTKEKGKTVVKMDGQRDVFSTINSLDHYLEVDSFDIVINSEYYLTNTNADSRNELKGIYVWHFEKGTLGKTMEFTISNVKNYPAIGLNYVGIAIIPIIILVILIICYIIYITFKRKFDEANSLK